VVRNAEYRYSSLAVSLALLVVGCGESAPNPRSLLLVTVDTLRADHMSSYGYERETSPGLDRLAAEGVRFRNEIVQRGGTWPSLTSILTSMYPRSHGVRSNGDPLDRSKRNVAELLREHGFRTAAFLTNMLSAEHRGFDEVVLFGDKAKRGRDGAAAADAAQWLRDHRDEKFFLWLHLMGPHDPYNPEPEYRERFDTGYVGPIDGSRSLLKNIHSRRHQLSERELAHIVSLYDADILQVDAKIRTVLDVLDEVDIASDTLVVFSSDHGEELYEHNFYFFHSLSIYESVLNVPLIFSLPGRIPRGKTVDAIVESIDLAPTMFELLGLPIPDEFEGKSLVPLISGDRNASAELAAAYSELGPYIQSVRTDRWHYIYNPRQLSSPGSREGDTGRKGIFSIAREELYDLLEDPEQKRNVVRDHPGVAAELRDRILVWRGSEANHYRAHDLSPKTREELEALGYID
jgi:arylsulfatase A-like enzyme